MIDVSEFQGSIHWPVVQPQRVLIRVTMGAAGVDAQATNNIHGAERNKGIVFGAYHFLENSSPQAQMEHFLNVYHPVVGNLRGMIDCERSQFSTPTRNLLIEAVEAYHNGTGHYPIVYGNSGDLAKLALPAWMGAKCPLMLADYGPNDGAIHPLTVGVPKPWHAMAIHQYTSVGHSVGITANTVDTSKVYAKPEVLLVPRPRMIIDYWQVRYVTRKGVHTHKNTRTPYAFAKLHRAEHHGKVTIYPHRKEA